ncbi:MAG: DNA topoisomerase [Culicoidibacterales bacterium]
MSIVYFCEKPSQAQALAAALSQKVTKKEGYYDGNDGKLYTYAYGHLTTLVAPEQVDPDFSWKGDLTKFPFLVNNIPIELAKQKGVAAQFKIIKGLFAQASQLVVATDAGREGEHIFRTVYQLAQCRKPFTRLWLTDMTDQGIQLANQQARPGSDYDGLALAGKLRAEADWLVGMNATIFAARTLQARISLGRVQTPTLKMLVQRYLEISQFTSRTYYTLIAPTAIEKVSFELQREGQSVELTQAEADELLAHLQPLPLTNFAQTQQQLQEAPPKLFDLTELQKVCNKQLNLTASDTLAIAQKLYEKKLTTYPRTSSQYLASGEGLLERVQALGGEEILNNGYQMRKAFINPKKVTDHDALIPTGKVPGNLSGSERAVFEIIRTRFFAAFYPNAKKTKVSAQFQKGDEIFVATQVTITELGWLKLYNKTIETNELALYTSDQVQPLQRKEIITQPKKPYNDSSLLSDMKNAAKFISDDPSLAKMLKTTDAQGIGTPATRAAIIEALIQRELVMRQGKQLQPTPKGIELIQALPDDFALCSPKMTAIWETLLAEVEAQTLPMQAFYEQLYAGIQSFTAQLSQLQPLNPQYQRQTGGRKKSKTGEAQAQTSTSSERQAVCACPQCGQPIFENEKGFSCSGFKAGCKVTIWKNGLQKLGKKAITKTQAKQLLQGKHPKVKLKSKAGKAYEAYALWNPSNNWITIQFDQPTPAPKSSRGQVQPQRGVAKPVAPKRAVPQPPAPQPMTPQPMTPQPMTPQPTVVQPSEPVWSTEVVPPNPAPPVAFEQGSFNAHSLFEFEPQWFEQAPDYSDVPLPPPPPEEGL